MAQELDQAQRRRYVVLMDDFTPPRKWESTIDIISQGTCAPINPKGWTDPLSTPQGVLMHAVQTDPESGRLFLALREGYAAWRDQLKRKAVEYDQRLYSDAVMLFGQEGPAAYEQKKPALLMHTGPGPQAWEPIEAALQGNSAALGRVPLASDPRIAKYFAKRVVPTLDLSDAALHTTEDLSDLDPHGALEEEADPDAIGGKTLPVSPAKAKLGRPRKALVEA